MSRSIQLALLVAVPLAFLIAMIVLDRQYGFAGGGYGYVVRIELPPANGRIGLPRIEGPPDASRPLVVIDPGHGGFDPGAGQGQVREKAVALQIARAIRDRLVAGGGIRVALTRDTDRFLTLGERPDIARRLGADLFVSIHADSIDNDTARGASVYVLSEKGSSEAAARIALRENQADKINGVSFSETSDAVDAILLDLSQREAQAGSYEAAELVLRELKGKVRLHREGVETAALAVLKAPDIPSVLFETGYISNPQDAEYLNSGEGRQTIAAAAAQAIRVFFARRAGA
ncbi:N-acetylmuramoyl-L-alanine amidase family protein [Novosphingobium album (ex Liu et al. 2023)]|uniref:N-acetylmuramoyl-L-alanine amidase n=1 Tax=Novosphingobium album (ex Liu et al. 2023) TaxID=3031130 RepID=A0ABT5WUH3_9SPHN|nr:N-acetylmuramoyl-L-alanine amidase [Novosphingobium album (ex Liu et al. 2023)]MDE8653522.1 N-acetylmuramoyl-L-alanine amidase [Novosphingobium album (ex Liu et al. 2023)]